MSPWLFSVHMNGQREKMGMGIKRVIFLGEGENGDCLAPCLHKDNLEFCSDL